MTSVSLLKLIMFIRLTSNDPEWVWSQLLVGLIALRYFNTRWTRWKLRPPAIYMRKVKHPTRWAESQTFISYFGLWFSHRPTISQLRIDEKKQKAASRCVALWSWPIFLSHTEPSCCCCRPDRTEASLVAETRFCSSPRPTLTHTKQRPVKQQQLTVNADKSW